MSARDRGASSFPEFRAPVSDASQGLAANAVVPSETPARFDRSLRLALWLLKMGPLLILALLILVIAI